MRRRAYATFVAPSRSVACTKTLPVQWAASLVGGNSTIGWQSCATLSAVTKKSEKAIGFRYHDGRPWDHVEGLLSRGDRRTGAVIEQVYGETAPGLMVGANIFL